MNISEGYSGWFRSLMQHFNRRRKRKLAARQLRLATESLETRIMKTVVSNGQLLIQGTNGADAVQVDQVDVNGQTMIRVTQNGTVSDFALSSITKGKVTFDGLAGDDVFRNNTSLECEVHAGDGDDIVFGGSAADMLFGDAGNDKLYGGQGSDAVYGGEGHDLLDEEGAGGHGDLLDGGAGHDLIKGGDGNDALYGQDGDDEIHAGEGNDLLSGAAGDDRLYGGNGIDTLMGDAGHDRLYGGQGGDTAYGGDGNDTLDEEGVGGDGDLLDGGAGNDLIKGGDGNDALFGGEGNDEIHGGNDIDMLDGGDGDDLLFGGQGSDSVYGRNGNDALDEEGAGGHGDLLDGGAGDDLIKGGDGNDALYGGEGNDLIYGGDGHDYIEGGDGDDMLYGGQGGDRVYGGNGNDVLDEEGAGGHGDLLDGGAGHDVIKGGDGNDALYGGEGDDVIYGGDGQDFLDGGGGNDALYGGQGSDVVYGGDGNDLLDEEGAGGHGDNLDGGAGDDVLKGGDGNDVLYGGAGRDLLVGGEGINSLRGDADDYVDSANQFVPDDKTISGPREQVQVLSNDAQPAQAASQTTNWQVANNQFVRVRIVRLAADSFTITTPSTQIVRGEAYSVTITAMTRFARGAYSGPVTLTMDYGGFGPATTITLSDQGTFTLIPPFAGNFTLHASGGGLQSNRVALAVLNPLEISGSREWEITAGEALYGSIAATGGSGRYRFALASSYPSGVNLDPATGAVQITTTEAGTHRFDVEVIDLNRPELSVISTYSLRVRAAGAASFAITPLVEYVWAGQTLTVQVAARDRYGNATDYDGSVTLISSHGQIAPSTNILLSGGRGSGGVATVGNPSSNVSITLTASAGALSSSNNAVFTVYRIPSVGNRHSTATVGAPFSSDLVDGYGGPYVVSVEPATQGGILPPGLSFSDTGRVYGTPTTAGTYRLYVYVGDRTHQGVLEFGRFELTVNPAAIESFEISASVTNVVTGFGPMITITAKDRFGNPTGYDGPVTVNSSNGHVISSFNITLTNGRWTSLFPVTAQHSGTTTLSVSSGSIRSDGVTINVEPSMYRYTYEFWAEYLYSNDFNNYDTDNNRPWLIDVKSDVFRNDWGANDWANSESDNNEASRNQNNIYDIGVTPRLISKVALD